MKVASFIPIKLNNQRLPGKNTMILNGRPLCDYIFDTICKVPNIDEKYVYCSNEAILPYVEPYKDKGLQFLKRDKYLDGFQVKGLEIIDRFVKDVDADIYVLTHVTQPFTKPESISSSRELLSTLILQFTISASQLLAEMPPVTLFTVQFSMSITPSSIETQYASQNVPILES